LTSKSTQTLYSIDTANISVAVEALDKPNVKHVRADWRLTPKDRITLGEGGTDSGVVSVLEDLLVRLESGRYSVSVVYEGEVKANATFAVVVDSDRTVPILINMLADRDRYAQNFARRCLFSIVGRPTWEPGRYDTEKLIDSELDALSKWWDENKGKPVFLNDVKVVSVSGQTTNIPWTYRDRVRVERRWVGVTQKAPIKIGAE
jgi:hypothetical protein